MATAPAASLSPDRCSAGEPQTPMSVSALRPLPIRPPTTTSSVRSVARQSSVDVPALRGQRLRHGHSQSVPVRYSPEPKKIASFWEQPRAGAGPSTKDDQVCLEPPKGGPEDGMAPDILF